jgi:ABC-type nitrate/sulfonate/bicarbonate transport system substrate-binding protein
MVKNDSQKGIQSKTVNCCAEVNMIRRFKPVIVLIGIMLIISGSLSCQGGYSEPRESITVGMDSLSGGFPIFVAADRQLFTQNGLNVTLKRYDTGVKAFDGLMNGEVNIAGTVSDYALASRVFDNPPVKTIGSIDKIDFVYIVARKDHGIANESDLIGKTIGLIPGTAFEFYLGRFLDLHKIDRKDVTFVDVGTFQQSVDAIVDGRVDAVICTSPYDRLASSHLGDNAVVWPGQSNQSVFVLLVCNNEWLRVNPKLAERFLKAINQAEEYIFQHHEEVRVIVKKNLNYTDDDISRAWSQNQFSLMLEESFIAAMEDEARWMINNNLVTEKQVPNFMEYIYEDALKAIKPEAVTIVH